MLVPSKKLWESKTVWLGIATILLSILEGVVDLVDLSGTQYAWATGVIGALIILLRYVTKQPVTVSGKHGKHVADRAA